jgi:hypothetical protein
MPAVPRFAGAAPRQRLATAEAPFHGGEDRVLLVADRSMRRARRRREALLSIMLPPRNGMIDSFPLMASVNRLRSGPRGTHPLMNEEPLTRELRERQADRVRVERAHARQGTGEEDTQVHDRRADRAAYLRRKLDERAASERRG